MFTGLVQKVGVLKSAASRSDGKRLCIRHDPWDEPVELGESIAVQGACLTVTAFSRGQFECDVLRETLEKTTVGGWRKGVALNLERSLKAGDRLGGHFVTGHVDAVGTVAGVTRRGDDWILEIDGGPQIMPQVVIKGSIAVDGVSLTIAELGARTFRVHLIPHTWSNTSLRLLRKGGRVNLETDILGKHVMKHLQGNVRAGVTMDMLSAAGFR